MFHYTCFEGTRGQGRIYPDGSVAGSIQVRGNGQMRYAVLPPGTIRVNGEAVCASVRGVPIHPCFNLQQLDNESFRGSISGLGFAYCDFTRRQERARILHRAAEHHAAPLNLRPSLAATGGE
jgi:hypothetical protein